MLLGRGEVLHPGGHGDGPVPVADGLGGVGHQVHDHLLELGAVRLDGGQVGLEPVVQGHPLGDGDLQQVRHLLGHLVEVQLLHHQPALARVGQHLVGQFRGPLQDLLDLDEEGRGLRLVAHVHLGQFQVAADGGQQVVEVVGDAPRQDPQALQLLRLAESILGVAPLGDVLEGAPQAHGLAVGSAVPLQEGVEEPGRAILQHRPEIHGPDLPPRHEPAHGPAEGGAILGVGAGHDRAQGRHLHPRLQAQDPEHLIGPAHLARDAQDQMRPSFLIPDRGLEGVQVDAAGNLLRRLHRPALPQGPEIGLPVSVRLRFGKDLVVGPVQHLVPAQTEDLLRLGVEQDIAELVAGILAEQRQRHGLQDTGQELLVAAHGLGGLGQRHPPADGEAAPHKAEKPCPGG